MKYTLIIAALVGTLTFEEVRAIQVKRDNVNLAQITLDADAEHSSDEEEEKAASDGKAQADKKAAETKAAAIKAAAEAKAAA